MVKLQCNTVRTKTLDGKPKRFLKYRVTIPNDIVKQARLMDGQMMQADILGKSIVLSNKTDKSDKTVKILRKRTRYYNNEPYYFTSFLVPISFIQNLKWTTGKNLDVSYRNNEIVITP